MSEEPATSLSDPAHSLGGGAPAAGACEPARHLRDTWMRVLGGGGLSYERGISVMAALAAQTHTQMRRHRHKDAAKKAVLTHFEAQLPTRPRRHPR